MTFVDANVLLEVLLKRNKVGQVMAAMGTADDLLCVSPLSIHLAYYYCRQQGVAPDALRKFFGSFKVLAMDEAVVKLAQRRYDGKDFEDCLQAACAEAAGCDRIFTLDRTFRRHSRTKLPVEVL